MLFSLLKHYLELYVIDTALKVSQSFYCLTTSICHGVENYFPRLWGTGISDASFECSHRISANIVTMLTTTFLIWPKQTVESEVKSKLIEYIVKNNTLKSL